MKLLSYTRNGKPSWGALEGNDRIVDLGHVAPTLRDALGQGGLGAIRESLAAADRGAALRLADVRLLPVIPNPEKIVCIGLNYEAHRLEAKRAETKFPTLFPRWPTSQTAHGAAIPLPTESEQLDFEGEIALVIGKGGRRIAKEDAWSHIAGYAPYNDASIRDWQYHTTQWGAGKNFDGTGAFGPWMVTRDEIKDGQRLELVTRLNGEEVQRGNTDQLIFSIPVLINYISTVMTLRPGDVIVTGTPSGVGVKREPQLFMKAGDRIEVEVSGLGRLENTVAHERTP
ncbi:fumarylacetoacetate hydrolase family protein [Ramlibacter albus]|uniref:Fumarylacetoacetate hydrolase family protein n=1 Tax=Ramlibacter albus TaxID=2079448 RepID=A0A923MDJ9_9BURK|nr:fumarylacetoacetate hydrolase family protein [Ramlibacter albus]MBC5768055.1 fumarylacetoacetate hydrolase family protein [Ramlibacter albus]